MRIRSEKVITVTAQALEQSVLESKDKNFGFDAQLEEYGDLMKKGIIDPAKVTRSAVENASSIAAMVLTTEAMITDKPEPEAAPAMPAGGMDPMGGMGGMGGF